MREQDPHCPVCGYTKEDAGFNLDHHLCSGKIPKKSEAKTIKCSACKDTGYMPISFDGLSSGKTAICTYCTYKGA